MRFCPSGLQAIQYLLDKASRYHPDWLAIRASYGMNGIFMHDKGNNNHKKITTMTRDTNQTCHIPVIHYHTLLIVLCTAPLSCTTNVEMTTVDQPCDFLHALLYSLKYIATLSTLTLPVVVRPFGNYLLANQSTTDFLVPLVSPYPLSTNTFLAFSLPQPLPPS